MIIVTWYLLPDIWYLLHVLPRDAPDPMPQTRNPTHHTAHNPNVPPPLPPPATHPRPNHVRQQVSAILEVYGGNLMLCQMSENDLLFSKTTIKSKKKSISRKFDMNFVLETIFWLARLFTVAPLTYTSEKVIFLLKLLVETPNSSFWITKLKF